MPGVREQLPSMTPAVGRRELTLDHSTLSPGYRASGLLLHITSLPSPYGIGDLGRRRSPGWTASMKRAKLVASSAARTTGYGNSPYQCLSSFVGNGLLISPELLIEDGLLQARRL